LLFIIPNCYFSSSYCCCCCKGDIAFRYLHYLKNLNQAAFENKTDKTNLVTICDINKNMLEVGKDRAKALGYTNGNNNFEFCL
jgi:ubiquinone/menaquinone biosynthesis C-methylase UbiE